MIVISLNVIYPCIHIKLQNLFHIPQEVVLMVPTSYFVYSVNYLKREFNITSMTVVLKRTLYGEGSSPS